MKYVLKLNESVTTAWGADTHTSTWWQVQPFSSVDDEAMRESATAVRARDKYQFQQVEHWIWTTVSSAKDHN